jgi:hypothetical protein
MNTINNIKSRLRLKPNNRQTKYIIEDIKTETETVSNKVFNKGTGAGGCNTNKNGLSYEVMTDLQSEYSIILDEIYFKTIKFNKNKSDKIFKMTKQSKFFKGYNEYINNNIPKAHGCKNPDECYINEITKQIFIIEKKFQMVNGSVCEKIQTSDFKIWQYSRTFPNFKIIYIYCLSDWFKKNCIAELEFLKYRNVPVFWGNSETYKNDIVKYIINY